MTPNRTAPPVARKLTESPAAPPLPVLVGLAATEDRLLLTEEARLLRDDTREEMLEPTLERLEAKLEAPEEREEKAEGTKST